MMRLHYTLIIAAALALMVTENTADAAGYRYSVTGCNFAVWFPKKPEIYTINVGDAAAREAQLQFVSSIRRAVCISGLNIFVDEPKFMTKQLQAFFDQNGIGSVTVKNETTKYGRQAEGRGYKKLRGIWATYVVVMYASRQSVMSLTVGSASNQYPTPEISAFLNSAETP